MRKFFLYFISVIFVTGTGTSEAKQPFVAKIREPAVAGRFYPGNASELSGNVKNHLEKAVKPSSGKPVAIISPHAGYVYSAQIAADAFNQAAKYDYDLIVLLGVNHTSRGFNRVSIYPGGGYKTPLGIAKIDEEAAARLTEAGEDFTFQESVHIYEHSIEVQVPFVQTLFPNAKILPAVVGVPDPDMCFRLGKALAKVLRDRNALIVASSDLSHYPKYEDAVRADRSTLEAILTLDPQVFRSVIRKQERSHIPGLATCACGEASILTVITAAKELGAKCAKIINYANSGDVPAGDRSRVVGYGAVSFLASDKNCQ